MRSEWMRNLMENVVAIREWEAANPKMAADWNAAIAENNERDAHKEWVAAQEAMMAQRAAHAPDFLASCGVGDVELDAFRAGLFDTPARVGVREWAASGKTVLLLHGGAGGGKSIAAAEALLEVYEYPLPIDPRARFITADWLARLSYYDLERYEPIARIKYLAIDDIGVEQDSSTFLATLDGLLNERIRFKRRTILTTNLSLKAFQERFAKPGSRIASRFAQVALAYGCGDTDLRRTP